MLTRQQIEKTAGWIAAQQSRSGALPWWRGGKLDPWDHVHSAMGLAVAGRFDEAARAYRYLARTQSEQGGWYAWRKNGRVSNRTVESNHAAYPATGLWQFYLATEDAGFLGEMWSTVERAIEFTVGLQEKSGVIAWAVAPTGSVWREPLLTSCASIHGSLVCALRIADVLDYRRPSWELARDRLADALTRRPELFDGTAVAGRVGRFSMDWYYPVLGGALRGVAARERLLALSAHDAYVAEGVGCRCVDDHPWYTVAETCEFVLALDVCGLTSRAQQVLSWTRQFRKDDGGYWTGKTYPEDVFWPLEDNAWTAAAVLVANDALERCSATSGLFRSLAADDLDEDDRAVAS